VNGQLNSRVNLVMVIHSELQRQSLSANALCTRGTVIKNQVNEPGNGASG